MRNLSPPTKNPKKRIQIMLNSNGLNFWIDYRYPMNLLLWMMLNPKQLFLFSKLPTKNAPHCYEFMQDAPNMMFLCIFLSMEMLIPRSRRKFKAAKTTLLFPRNFCIYNNLSTMLPLTNNSINTFMTDCHVDRQCLQLDSWVKWREPSWLTTIFNCLAYHLLFPTDF